GGTAAGTTVYDDQAAPCLSGDPNADPKSFGAGDVGGSWDGTQSYGIWSMSASYCHTGFSPDDARMFMSDIVDNASPTSNNVPTTFTVSQSTTTGTDNNPIQIT